MHFTKLKKLFVIAAMAVSVSFAGAIPANAATLADTVYHNGTIYTMTETKSEAKDVANAKTVQVVATQNGKIVFAGSLADATAKGFFIAGNVANMVDLKGKTMLPGFVDGHGHFPSQGNLDLYEVNLNSPPLGKMNSIEDYVEVLGKRAEITLAGEWIKGWGYDDTLVSEKRHPTKEDLDKVSTTNPIYVNHISGHMGVANSVALAMLSPEELKTEGVIMGPDGKPTGLLLEMAAMAVVTSKIPGATKVMNQSGLARADQVYAAAGVTTTDQGGSTMATGLGLLQNGLKTDQLNLRVITHPIGYYGAPDGSDRLGWMNRAHMGWSSTSGIAYDVPGALKNGDDITSHSLPAVPAAKLPAMPAPEGLPEDYLFFGHWKFIYDGSNQGYTGWFKGPGYYDSGMYAAKDSFDGGASGSFIGLPGTLNFSAQKLEELIDFYHARNQSVEVHTNGSAAAETFVAALEKAVFAHKDKGITDTRHTSIHGQTMERQHVERLIGKYETLPGTAGMYTDKLNLFDANGNFDPSKGTAELGSLMKSQNMVTSYFINHTYFWGDRHLSTFMGPGRGKNMNPAGWSAYYDHDFTLHNDTNVTPISPLRSLHSATTRVSFGGQLVSGNSKDINATANYKPTVNAAEATPFWDYDQRVNVIQALHGVTIAPAFQNKLDDRIGSIEAGKLADFVILDENPVEVWKTNPMHLADLRVTSTIVNDEVIHGVLPGSSVFVSQFRPAFIQAANVAVSNLSSSVVPQEVAVKNYASLPTGHNVLGVKSFTANVTEGKTGVFQFTMLGNNGSVKDMFLTKLHANKVQSYTYGRPLQLDEASGMWWISDIEDPTTALEPDDFLTLDKTYVVTFGVRDNDANYDMDMTPGVITDPVALSTTGNLPRNGIAPAPKPVDHNGGSSSGCTVSPTGSSFELVLLLGGLLATFALRSMRRRENS